MHNYKVLSGNNSVPRHFWGSVIGGLAQGVGSSLLGGGKGGDGAKSSGSGLSGVMGTMGGVAGIFNAQGNTSQKQMQRADSIVDGVSSAVSLIPGFGTAIGAGIQLVNKLGGAFIKQPSFMKNYTTNQNVVQNAAAFGGVASNAQDAESTAQTYNKSGLAGKLVGRNNSTRNRFQRATDQQLATQGILDENTFAKENMGSADLFSTRNSMALQGNIWNRGNILFGKKGGTLTLKVKAAIKKHQFGGTVASVTQLASPVSPTVKIKSNKNHRSIWNGFVDFIDQKGYKGSPELDSRDKNLSRDLWEEYSKNSGIDLPYDEFIPQVQSDIANYRNLAIEDMRSGRRGLENFTKDQLSKSDFDFDNNFMKGLSKVDGWAGSRTTSWKFPKEYVVDKNNKYDPLKNKGKVLSNNIYSNKEGGKIENVIVTGELHARKHNLKDKPQFKDANITVKGVPVVTAEGDECEEVLAQGGKITQVAEVEREEIILHYDLTKELERLAEEGTPEAAIEAGKLLSKELIRNTKDKSKLRQKVLADG